MVRKGMIDLADILPEGTICVDCVYCKVKCVTPDDASEWYLDDYDDLPEDEPLFTASCYDGECLTNHIVHDCTAFDDGTENNPFMGNKFL